MKRIRLIILSLAALLATACSAPKIAYLEDINSGQTVQIANVKNIRILPDDKISVLVNSRDPPLSNLFNLPYVTKAAQGRSTTSLHTARAFRDTLSILRVTSISPYSERFTWRDLPRPRSCEDKGASLRGRTWSRTLW